MRLACLWPLAAALAATSSSAHLAETCARFTAQSQAQGLAREVPQPAAVVALQQRSDLRSQALADYLIAASGAAGGDAARDRLQDRARSSTDPMLTVLALHMPCVRAGCRNVEASQWSRLEPANLLAWLTLPARSGADGRYLLDEIATQVRYVRSYREEADALLAGLPPSGLALRQPWGLFDQRALASVFRSPGDVATAQRSDAAAELLWADGGATERLTALVLGLQARLLLPHRQAVWAPRLRELEAVIRGFAGQPQGLPISVARPRLAQVCEALAQPRGGEGVAPGDWAHALTVLQFSGWPVHELYPRRSAGERRPLR